jgi:hypothetical protein
VKLSDKVASTDFIIEKVKVTIQEFVQNWAPAEVYKLSILYGPLSYVPFSRNVCLVETIFSSVLDFPEVFNNENSEIGLFN